MTISYRSCAERALGGHRRSYIVSQDHQWIELRHRHAALPAAGWKIHISSLANAALDTIQLAVAAACRHDCHLKLAGSEADLHELNSEQSGTQVGKFITIYPSIATSSTDLMLDLVESFSGCRGPLIPFDVRAADGSPVHYRWGQIHDHAGEDQAGIRYDYADLDDGSSIIDTRKVMQDRATWPDDPFVAAGLTPQLPGLPRIAGERFLLMEQLRAGIGGAVHSGLDLRSGKRCVIKTSARDALLTEAGWDKRDLLLNECRILKALAASPTVANLVELIDDGPTRFLVTSQLQGPTLERLISDLSSRGRSMPLDELRRIAEGLATALLDLSSRGVLYADLTPSNVVLAEDQVCLVDLEFARLRDAGGPGHGITPGFAAPEAAGSSRPDEAQLVFGFAATVIAAALGGPTPTRETNHLMRTLRPDVASAFPGLEQALDVDPEMRPSLDEILAPGEQRHSLSADSITNFGREALDVLVRALTAQTTGSEPTRDVDDGLAGALLALVVAPELDDAAAAVADDLVNRLLGPIPEWRAASGLFVGEAGVGLSLLLAGERLARRDATEGGIDLLEWAYEHRWDKPDLYAGAAGQLITFIRAAAILDAPLWRSRAVEIGNQLVSGAVADRGGSIRFPTERPESPQPLVDMAHGVAGVVAALIELDCAWPDEQRREVISAAMRWVVEKQSPEAESGVWPVAVEGDPRLPAWCHGGSGIGRMLLIAKRSGLSVDERLLRDVAMRVSNVVHSGPTLCHGVAGTVRLLADLDASIEPDDRIQRRLQAMRRVLHAELDELARRSHPPVGLLTGLGGISVAAWDSPPDLGLPV